MLLDDGSVELVQRIVHQVCSRKFAGPHSCTFASGFPYSLSTLLKLLTWTFVTPHKSGSYNFGFAVHVLERSNMVII
jgi:hypothetical protein